MLLSEVIENLQAKLAEHGDMTVYTNSEHGIVETPELEQGMVSAMAADLILDDNHSGNKTIVCHIGGY